MTLNPSDLENVIGVMWTWYSVIVMRFVTIRPLYSEDVEKMPRKVLI